MNIKTIFFTGILLASCLSLLSRADEPTAPQIIKVSAKKFDFTPNVIKVKKGVPVIIELTTEDRKHGFKSKELNLEASVKPGETTQIKFTPDKAGSFPFHCNAFCGSGHEGMTGTIEVSDD